MYMYIHTYDDAIGMCLACPPVSVSQLGVSVSVGVLCSCVCVFVFVSVSVFAQLLTYPSSPALFVIFLPSAANEYEK